MPILSLFTSDGTVLFYASRYVVVMLLSQWMFAVFNAISCLVNGLGRVRYTTAVNLAMLWAVRIPVAWMIAHYGDGTWIMLAFPASFGFGMLCMILYSLMKSDSLIFRDPEIT